MSQVPERRSEGVSAEFKESLAENIHENDELYRRLATGPRGAGMTDNPPDGIEFQAPECAHRSMSECTGPADVAIVYRSVHGRELDREMVCAGHVDDRVVRMVERRSADIFVEGPQRSSFTCPKCGMVSHNLFNTDAGYCGACHDWTG